MAQSSTPSTRTQPAVVLTGGAGFIGAALARELDAAGARVLCLDDLSSGRAERLAPCPRVEFRALDISRPAALGRCLEDFGPVDHLVHLAARVGVRTVLRDPVACRDENLAGVRSLIQVLGSMERAPRLWAASTSEVYRSYPGPVSEAGALREEAGQGRWAYAGSKLRGERELDAIAHLWPASRGPVHLRFFNVVGPGQDADQGMVLPTFVERALGGRGLQVHGDGEQVRTLAHVDQVARLLAWLMLEGRVPSGPLNVGGVARTDMAGLAHCVARLARAQGAPPVSIEHVDPQGILGPKFEEIPWREPCLERLTSCGGPMPDASLEMIVGDALARHSELALPEAGGAGRTACASPAS